MKRIILFFSLYLFFAVACTNSGSNTHSQDEETHSHTEGQEHGHDEASHSHDHGEGTHTHADGTTHADHDQEEFTVEQDTTKEDSLRNQ
jgi:ABC-type nickel/cobalt efflux system permease component RcnA